MKDRNIDPVNDCPFYSREPIIIGPDGEYDVVDICNKPSGTFYCMCELDDYHECKYYREEHK